MTKLICHKYEEIVIFRHRPNVHTPRPQEIFPGQNRKNTFSDLSHKDSKTHRRQRKTSPQGEVEQTKPENLHWLEQSATSHSTKRHNPEHTQNNKQGHHPDRD